MTTTVNAATLTGLCDLLLTTDNPMEELEPESFAVRFSSFFGLSTRPDLTELTEVFQRAGIGTVSEKKLPSDLRGIHYTLPDGGNAIHYQPGQWEASIEFTILHEGYEICYETLWRRCYGRKSNARVCNLADRFAAAVLMPRDIFASFAHASGLDVVELHHVFRCSYSAVAIRLAEVVREIPLMVVLYQRDELGHPAQWPSTVDLTDLRANVVRSAGGFGWPRTTMLNGHLDEAPAKGRSVPAGSLAELAVQSGRVAWSEDNGIVAVAKPVSWHGSLAKVTVVAVNEPDRMTLLPQLHSNGYHQHRRPSVYVGN